MNFKNTDLKLYNKAIKKDYVLENNSLNSNQTPIFNITQNNNFYDVYISLRGLSKDEILVKYINNFLIFNLSLKNKNNNSIKYKRSFYLKNIDIDKIENIICANLIYLKIPKIINSKD
ncbi:hypothetical protein JCM1393_12290 [Clostridium carnis]